MLDWLGEIVSAVTKIFPRITVVNSTHKGIAFVRGKKPRIIEPGLYFWWPVVTNINIYPVVRQSLDLPTQILTTQDSISVVVSGVVVYTVDDIMLALVDQWDMNETIHVMSMAALRDVICSTDFAILNQSRAKIDKKILTALSRELKPYGINTIDAKLTDFARCSVLAVASPGGRTFASPIITNFDDNDESN